MGDGGCQWRHLVYPLGGFVGVVAKKVSQSPPVGGAKPTLLVVLVRLWERVEVLLVLLRMRR